MPLPKFSYTVAGATQLAYKDPTVVETAGRIHLVVSHPRFIAGKTRYFLAYLSFPFWGRAAEASVGPLFIHEAGVYVPFLFHFRPHSKWYLFYGWKHPESGEFFPAYSTWGDLDRPESLSAVTPVFSTFPASLPRRAGVRWLDFTVIADERRVYLFFTNDGGQFLGCSTSLADFPRGWSDPSVLLSRPRSEIFEGNATYRLKNDGRYLTIIEAIGPENRRFSTLSSPTRSTASGTPPARCLGTVPHSI